MSYCWFVTVRRYLATDQSIAEGKAFILLNRC